jgi:hypothetical protein
VIASAVLFAVLGGGLFAGWIVFGEHAWDPEPLRSYLPTDAREVRTGGSSAFLTSKGACAFSSSPAALDKLTTSPGFTDITSDVEWWREELDRIARRHLGQSLDSLGTVRIYQKSLRDEGDLSEDVFVIVNAAHDRAILLYLFQQ